MALEAPTRVIVEGSRGRHSLAIDAGRSDLPATADALAAGSSAAGTSTAIGEEVLVNAADRQAMVALFAGYLLDPPHYDPHPRTYEAAAKRLGWTRTKLLRRIEYLRLRLTNAGVPSMSGASALYNLAEYALSRKLITKVDLALLPQQPMGARENTG
jgi:hypothetical protein